MSKRTPGKWIADFDGEHWNVIVEGGEGFLRDIVGCEGLYRCDGSDEANARLIAAAPELLEALEAMRAAAEMEDWDGRSSAYALAEKAIAKATGE